MPVADSTAPRVDWAGEAVLAAQGAVARMGKSEEERFSPAPKALPAPCKPKESSMEWKGYEDRRVGLAGGIFPYVRVGRCAVGLGFFGCSLDKPPPANVHLLDDMKDGARSDSSVPDPHVCD
jgi:hypothetical protein